MLIETTLDWWVFPPLEFWWIKKRDGEPGDVTADLIVWSVIKPDSSGGSNIFLVGGFIFLKIFPPLPAGRFPFWLKWVETTNQYFISFFRAVSPALVAEDLGKKHQQDNFARTFSKIIEKGRAGGADDVAMSNATSRDVPKLSGPPKFTRTCFCWVRKWWP